MLLHGWGADADDLMPLGSALRSEFGKKIDLVALRAPDLHPQGVGREWYGLFPPIWSSVPPAIASLRVRLKALETPLIPLSKTVLLGFSQGGAMALEVGCELPFAGLICCSSYGHPGWKAPKERPPVLLIHGREDNVVPYEASKQLIIQLKQDCETEADLWGFSGSHCIPGEFIPKMQMVINKWFLSG